MTSPRARAISAPLGRKHTTVSVKRIIKDENINLTTVSTDETTNVNLPVFEKDVCDVSSYNDIDVYELYIIYIVR